MFRTTLSPYTDQAKYLTYYKAYCNKYSLIDPFKQELCIHNLQESFITDHSLNEVKNKTNSFSELRLFMSTYLRDPSSFTNCSMNKNKCLELLAQPKPITLQEIVKFGSSSNNNKLFSKKERIGSNNIINDILKNERDQLFSIIKLVCWDDLCKDYNYKQMTSLIFSYKDVISDEVEFKILEIFLWLLWYAKSITTTAPSFSSINDQLQILSGELLRLALNLNSNQVSIDLLLDKKQPETSLCKFFINIYLESIRNTNQTQKTSVLKPNLLNAQNNSKISQQNSILNKALSPKNNISISCINLVPVNLMIQKETHSNLLSVIDDSSFDKDYTYNIVEKISIAFKKYGKEIYSNSIFPSVLGRLFRTYYSNIAENILSLCLYHSLLYLFVEVRNANISPKKMYELMQDQIGQFYCIGNDTVIKIGINQEKDIEEYIKRPIFGELDKDLEALDPNIKCAAYYLMHILPLLKRKEDHENQINLYKNYFKGGGYEIRYEDVEYQQRISYFSFTTDKTYVIHTEFFKIVSLFAPEPLREEIEKIYKSQDLNPEYIKNFGYYSEELIEWITNIDKKNTFYSFLFESFSTLGLINSVRFLSNKINVLVDYVAKLLFKWMR